MLLYNNGSIGENKEEIINHTLPNHIAIIMDGNGRWAKSRFLPRKAGHREGVKKVKPIVEECKTLGVKYLTLYALSTENWNRPKEEISYLMKLLVEFLKKEINHLVNNGVKLRILGDLSRFNPKVKEHIYESIEKTKDNDEIYLNIALNYGGRVELVRAIKTICDDVLNNRLNENDITEELIKDYLYTNNQPDPDLLIRTGGEYRISNFLIYQSAYTEYWFTDINWPDFKPNNLRQAISDYQNRERRFGGLKE